MLERLAKLTPGFYYQFLMSGRGEIRWLYLPDELATVLGVSVVAFRQNPAIIDHFILPSMQLLLQQALLDAAAQQAKFSFCLQLQPEGGRNVWLDIHLSPKQKRQATLWTGFVYDVTELKTAFDQVASTANLTRNILDNMLDAVINIDSQGKIIYANQTAMSLFGYSAAELLGRNVNCLMGNHHASRHDDYLQNYANTGEHRIIGNNRLVEAKHKDHSLIPVELRVCELNTSQGRTFLGVVRDLRHKLTQQQKIDRLTMLDALTGLPNRTALIRTLNECIDSLVLKQGEYCLLSIDADDFKTINDGYGFDVGDEFLRQIAAVLLEQNQFLIMAKTGEDEFAAILESGFDLNHTINTVLQLQLLLKQPFQVMQHTISCSFSVGAYCFSTADLTSSDVVRNSEMALHHAKQTGRGTYQFYNPQMDEHKRHAALLDQWLKAPSMLDNFYLVYQSQQNEQGEIIGFEALMRWNCHGQMIPPDVFIVIAERNGAIFALGQWLLHRACQFLLDLQKVPQLQSCRVSINISPKQFAAATFASDVLQVLADYGIAPSKLHLELTERLLLENSADVLAKMRQLNEAGISFSLDDFGTGYSSLSYLKQLPLQELKIDKSFVLDLANSESDQRIVQAILHLAEGLRLDVIAEGVETELHRQTLSSLGCRKFQGYLYGRPQHADFWLDFHHSN